MKTRIGAVSYLNTLPLVHGLEQGLGAGRIDLSYDVPSALAAQLSEGKLDVALLPTIDLARIDGLTVLPGIGIAARGDVRSVVLVSKRPLSEVRSVALDPDSRTSNALVQILFAEHWGASPRFEPRGSDLETVLGDFDAALRIGDKALVDTEIPGTEVHDLSAAWWEMTGLPFVFAIWTMRDREFDPRIVEWLDRSYRQGAAVLPEIARRHASTAGVSEESALRYLSRDIQYVVSGEELRGMRRFLTLAAKHRLIPKVPEVRLYERQPSAVSASGDGP